MTESLEFALGQQAMRMQAKLQAVERLADAWERIAEVTAYTEGMFAATTKAATLRECADELRIELSKETGRKGY